MTSPPPPSKRVKLDADRHGSPSSRPLHERISTAEPASIRTKRAGFLDSISRSISPPAVSRSGTRASPTPPHRHGHGRRREHDQRQRSSTMTTATTPTALGRLPSPFKLTSIRDLPASRNVDTVSLHDILGNPLIKEAWIFNFCFDVDWLMDHFDADVRAQVQVKVVHGSWRAEDGNRLGIEDACRRWPNVESVTAYLPDPFGTHHSKMFILFTHDDLAQVVIHTANMLHKDWTNMTQAVWQSPMLPKITATPSTSTSTSTSTVVGRVGTGSRFKHDLMAYLSAYGSKTKRLRDQLVRYDFGRVRGALIASVPSRIKKSSTTTQIRDTDTETEELWHEHLWGYPSLFRALETICRETGQRQSKNRTTVDQANTNTTNTKNPQPHPRSHTQFESHPHPRPYPHVVCQVSSIATLPMTWLNQFFPAICGRTTSEPSGPGSGSGSAQGVWTDVSVIYPTPNNVAHSLDGYASGGSIHTKAQSAAHLKQITSLRKSLCQWTRGPLDEARTGRDLAAPHVKTYVRFRSQPTMDDPTPDIDWALLTSANLSTQAWGALRGGTKDNKRDKTDKTKGNTSKGGQPEVDEVVVVQSFEIGVLVWPGLFSDDFAGATATATNTTTNMTTTNSTTDSSTTVRMVPVFGQDTPSLSSSAHDDSNVDNTTCTLVGLRLPYDLPLTAYAEDDMPWSPQGRYDAPDRHGRRWPRDFL